jgi:hypothetical protein
LHPSKRRKEHRKIKIEKMHDAGKKIKKRRINKKVKVTGRESRSDAQ